MSLLLFIGFIVAVLLTQALATERLFTLSLLFTYLLVYTVLAPSLVLLLLWPGFILAAVMATQQSLRLSFLTRPILAYMKKSLPQMSQTEKIALEAGDVWLEQDIFQGSVNWQTVSDVRKPKLSNEEQAFLDNECESLCQLINDFDDVHKRGDLSPEVWTYIKENGFFGLIIPKEYGGHGFSPYCHSQVVLKLATRSISAAVSVMVPNSLGPAELLLNYGTQAQREAHLPRLAKGLEIPCFALTAPNAGSDATSLTDIGEVIEHEGQLAIKLSWDKRYITLAPIATLIGVAFKLQDPNNLLGKDKEDIGITLAIIPSSHKGVERGNRHSPLGLAFMNGTTRGKDVIIPMDWVIGGESQVGEGWRMLMECLSIGRSISLPALATAACKLSFRTTGSYAALRQQFKLPIGEFEGVKLAMGRIGGLTYLADAVRTMTADSVGLGVKPSLVSAITKYHLTEIARTVINDAMDIHAGRAIQYGPRNYLGLAYQSIPMSITVEGANILTRNLIIFGQGAVRCHPYLRTEMDAMAIEDKAEQEKTFDGLLLKHINYACGNQAKVLLAGLTGSHGIPADAPAEIKTYIRQLKRLSYALAFISDITFALLGGSLKRKECLSARLGDVLSYLYMAMATLKYYQDAGFPEEDKPFVQYAVQHCFHEAQEAIVDFSDNFPISVAGKLFRLLSFPLGRSYKKPVDSLAFTIADAMQQDSSIRTRLTQECYQSDDRHDALGRLDIAFNSLIEARPLLKKVNQAIKSKAIVYQQNFTLLIDSAKNANVITASEAQALLTFEALRVDALDVDEFTFNELFGGEINEEPVRKTAVHH